MSSLQQAVLGSDESEGERGEQVIAEEEEGQLAEN
jgi:hypothetical protein